MNSLLRVFAIMHKEFLQLIRDRLTFGMVIGIPLIQLTLFGYAINTDVRNLTAGVADQSNSNLSHDLISEIAASQVVNFEYVVGTAEELVELLDNGKISIGLYLPADFDRRVLERDRAAAQLMIDGTDPIILGVGRQLSAVPLRFRSTAAMEPQESLLEIRNYYNPERRSAVNIVPGLIGVILTMTMVLFTAVAIVREKERGNLEFLITTPVKTAELMLGKIVPYVLIGLIQVTIILSLGRYVFSVPVRGELLEVFYAALLFIATNLSLGLLISTAARTQFQAMQMTFFFFLPSILISGFMFPFDGMPRAAQVIAEVLPLTHFNRLIRGIVLRGAELSSLANELTALLIFMAVCLSLAAARFSKRLD